MTWLVESDRDPTPAGDRLARLWARPAILTVPGAHSPLAALLARQAGFEALYLSGAALSASLGLPDLGLLALAELVSSARAVSRASGLPLIVDGDTGYGEALNVVRLVRELEDAGAAAVQVEDQVLPKKCGHLSGKRLVPPEEMAAKVAAAVRASRAIRIIARTDAVETEGLDGAVARARRYREAGAHAIFADALRSEDEFRSFARAVPGPLLANMTEFGQSPLLDATTLHRLGYAMVIWPASSLRVAARAMSELYAELAKLGTQSRLLPRMQTRAELYDLIGYHEYEALDGRIATSVLPGAAEPKRDEARADATPHPGGP
jgi:methylisocitrate lyase